MPLLEGAAGARDCQGNSSTGGGVPAQGVHAKKQNGYGWVVLGCWASWRLTHLEGYSQWVCSRELLLMVLSPRRRREEDRDGRGRAPHVCGRAGHLAEAVQVQGRKDS